MTVGDDAPGADAAGSAEPGARADDNSTSRARRFFRGSQDGRIPVRQSLLVGLTLLLATALGVQVVASAAEDMSAGARLFPDVAQSGPQSGQSAQSLTTPQSPDTAQSPHGSQSAAADAPSSSGAPAEGPAPGAARPDTQPSPTTVARPKGIATRPFLQYWNGDIAGMRSDLDAVKAAKASWLRVPLRYTTSPDPDFDALVRMAEKRHITLLVTVGKPSPQRDLGTPADESRYRAWLARSVKRYGHYVKHWMVLNEPNLRYDWTIDYAVDSSPAKYQASVDRYVRHLRNSYQVIKQLDPGATVIFGGLSEWRVERYVDALARTDAYRYFDVMALHPYGRTPAQVLGRYRSFTAKMASHPDYASKPVWITEFGFNSTWSHKPGYVGTEKRKAKYMVDAMHLLNAAGVDGPIFWYNLHQDRAITGFGLIRRPAGSHRSTPLPGFAAFRDLSLTQPAG